MRMAKVQRPIEFKDIASGEMSATNDNEGIVEGYLNRTSVIDYTDDKSIPGCFAVTIKDSYARKAAQDLDYLWPFLWSHNVEILPPGGIFYADEDRKGLFIKVQLNRDIQSGRELYSSFKNRTVSKLSMGYKTIRSTYEKIEGKSIRLLHEVAVLEGSAVIFPANDLSQVTVVKSGGTSMNMLALRGKDFDSRYQDQQVDDWCYSDWNDLTTALQQAVQDCFTQSSDPMGALESDVIPQLATALRAYVGVGVSLGAADYLGEQQGNSPMMSMMSLSGGKSGYLSVSGHQKIGQATTHIMQHVKIIQSELAALESARSRARAGQLAGWPVYGSMSDRSIFEEKEEEAEALEMIGVLNESLKAQSSLRELKELREESMTENPLVANVDHALRNLLAKLA